jgi:hypothetical protein
MAFNTAAKNKVDNGNSDVTVKENEELKGKATEAATKSSTAPKATTAESNSSTKDSGKVDGTQAKILPDVSVPPAPTDSTADTTQETEGSEEKKKFLAMSTEDVWKFFGGENTRGVVSKAIRYLNAVGFTRSEIATKLGKRYQHVRNVLAEDARLKK